MLLRKENRIRKYINVQAILYSGWIYYYSPSQFRSSWKKRYLVLTDTSLQFYKSSFTLEVADLSLPITQCKYIQPYESCKRSKHALRINTTDPQLSPIEFYCKLKPEYNTWKEVITLQIMTNCPTIKPPTNRRIKTISTLDKWLNRSYPLIGSSLSDPPIASAPVPSQSTPVPQKPDSLSLSISIPQSTNSNTIRNIHSTNQVTNRRPMVRDIWQSPTNCITGKSGTTYTPLHPPPRRCMTIKSTHGRHRPPSVCQYSSRISASLTSPTFGCAQVK
ncbi:hypothetical protein F4703DRAFT_1941940 [Phycomyces blakesleeanus]|uniref:PH domain-containing protein n=1 Tax=Phycomyces blakesleeanus (strain ATCC 8743b / DSM 1359 / FGSC 10004 / NBRC 33097 / NRRL 1555) TaxID=763407 RepID=A0A167KVE7_PHYB8|nr:hypothetical protein PHYBLDRAFT_67074 [Phycomyces blakesleeanus NRRL 1555(-)]OAD68978.1 hypothetical protein PHYBLDRAFT_67074 [Phycomyces blakesleeanus NRRL 1555(-)]|eukprot:XP_018287018.1 hypothetical protein PHYBLDRAFT_67074 [Phycomyces blakesleeanus NRRL 1555(-)]